MIPCAASRGHGTTAEIIAIKCRTLISLSSLH